MFFENISEFFVMRRMMIDPVEFKSNSPFMFMVVEPHVNLFTGRVESF